MVLHRSDDAQYPDRSRARARGHRVAGVLADHESGGVAHRDELLAAMAGGPHFPIEFERNEYHFPKELCTALAWLGSGCLAWVGSGPWRVDPIFQ